MPPDREEPNVQVNLDRIQRWLPAIAHTTETTIERFRAWLPVAVHARIPRKAVLIATALTAAAVLPHPSTAATAPAREALMPYGVQVQQQTFTPSAEQMANAEAIVAAGDRMDVPERAKVIAVATALQESTLHNYGHLGDRNDHDSQGLFQQRPSAGWGTPEQITKPDYAATQFYESLTQVPGWQRMPLTEAAQSVQVSAYPDAYAKWEEQAADMVLATHGKGPYADVPKK
jgi:hypothetical protein